MVITTNLKQLKKTIHSQSGSIRLVKDTISKMRHMLRSIVLKNVPAPPVRFRSETVGKRRMFPQLNKVNIRKSCLFTNIVYVLVIRPKKGDVVRYTHAIFIVTLNLFVFSTVRFDMTE